VFGVVFLVGGMCLASLRAAPLRISIQFLLLRSQSVNIRSLLLALGFAAFPAVSSAQVLDLGGGGAFTNPINPTNTGRTLGWFWDNLSADQTVAATECNVGFFAIGTMSAGCTNQATGTLANQGHFVGGTGFGSGDGYQPPPFMFSGEYGYNLKLVGSLAGLNSEFGIFMIAEDGSYLFTAIPSFGAKVIGSTYSVGYGTDWGFYIRNTFNPATGGCLSPTNDCSDATGGYTGASFQQFVLMRSAGQDANGYYTYLAGAEDNRLDLMNNPNFYDSDYNDYIVEVTVVGTTTTPEPMSMALMATGLVGLAGAGFVQRRRRRNPV